MDEFTKWQVTDANGVFLNSEPWSADNEISKAFSYLAVKDDKGVVALVVQDGCSEEDEDSMIAKAKLIAAAPQIREALQAIIDTGTVAGGQKKRALEALALTK